MNRRNFLKRLGCLLGVAPFVPITARTLAAASPLTSYPCQLLTLNEIHKLPMLRASQEFLDFIELLQLNIAHRSDFGNFPPGLIDDLATLPPHPPLPWSGSAAWER